MDPKLESPILDASDLSPPAAAIICGLNGLVEEAKLPFLECCMPWTILVCRWCALSVVNLPPLSRRGESAEFCACWSDEAPLIVRLEGEVDVEEGSRASVPALGMVVDVVEGFSVVFQTSISSGERFGSLSPQLSGD
jgi:hypothetical protein